MIVAALAWDQMTPMARARATELLRLNPQYAEWAKGASPDLKDKWAFMEAATWPDDIRGKVCKRPPAPGCYRDDHYTPDDADADTNIGYEDHRLRRYWHFKDLGFSPDGTAVEEPFRVNAATQIQLFANSLEDARLGDEAKSFDLTWLLHLVGDVHQPLHATSRFTDRHRHGDSGANTVFVCLPNTRRCDAAHSATLHSFWDGALGTSNLVASAYAKAKALPPAPASLNRALAPDQWLTESLALARTAAYRPPIGIDGGPYRLTSRYRLQVGPIAEQRVIAAGARLAALLNTRLAP